MTSTDEPIKVYIGGDTGPSGFGVATKGLVRSLLERDDVLVNLRTHQWGWNTQGLCFEGDSNFGDERFEHFIRTNGYVNKEYVCKSAEEVNKQNKKATPLTEDLKHNSTVKNCELMIKQFEGKEDVWIGIGGQNFAEHAPGDDDIHTILSTDFNLSLVPRDWEHYLEQVDEVWVPSDWTKKAITDRFDGWRDDIVEKTRTMKYGILQNYKPTEYDCEACPNQHQSRSPESDQCLRDGKFNFLVVSRFYHIKGVYRTIKAFLEEFGSDEEVRLFFKTTSNQQFDFDPRNAIKQVLEESDHSVGNHPEIGIKTSPFDQQHMYDLYGHADCFLQMSRAECFGIAQLEAAYCRTPVIYTNWSSQRELMDENNSGLIPVNDYSLESPEPEIGSLMYAGANDYPRDSKWAVPNVEAIQNKMRQVYEEEASNLEEMGKDASQHVKDNFNWDEKAEERVNRIKEVAN